MPNILSLLPNVLSLCLGMFAVVAGALVGCGAAQPGDDLDGTELTFLLNGERWAANIPNQAIVTDFGLVVFSELRFEDRFPLRQEIGFSAPWRGVGTYPIAAYREDGELYGAYVNEADGDATIALYQPVGPAAERGGFEVTHYDEATSQIEGRFEGVFVVIPRHVGQPRRELPDTLRVTEGRFRAVVEDRR